MFCTIKKALDHWSGAGIGSGEKFEGLLRMERGRNLMPQSFGMINNSVAIILTFGQKVSVESLLKIDCVTVDFTLD